MPTIKIHYYSFYIPKKTKSIELEINLNYMGIYIKKGIKKFYISNLESFNKKYFGNIIYKLTPQDCGLESFEGEYITIGLANYLLIENSNYYFRILQKNSDDDYLIYPIDTNKANLCNTTLINGSYSCFFLIDNIFKDLCNDLIIYAYGHKKVKYTVWFVEKNESDYYSIDLKNLNFKHNETEEEKVYFLNNKKIYANISTYILIKLESSEKEEEMLTILTNFYDNKTFFPPIHIYSYQLIYLYNNETFNINFTKVIQKQYRCLINSTYGNGQIGFDPDSETINQYNKLISGNRTLSYVITKELNNIDIYNNQSNNRNDDDELLFCVKIVYELENSILEELYFNNDYNGITKTSFKTKFFLKEVENEGSDINFQFRFNFSINAENEKDFIIRGYAIKYDIMKLITEKTFIPINFGEEIIGRFDYRSKHGLIVFEKDKNPHLDNYYLVEIGIKDDEESNITMDIYASSKKDDSHFSIPINKYIAGSFDLKNDQWQSQRYYINDAQDSNSDLYIIDFSSNYKYLELKPSESLQQFKEKKIFAGITKYINKNNRDKNYFDIRINTTVPEEDKNSNYCKAANYIIMYYQQEKAYTDYEIHLQGKINKKAQNIIIENKKPQKLVGNFTITYIFNIYEEKSILKDENLNTIAPIDSDRLITQTDNIHDNYYNASFELKNENININKNDKGTAFIIIKNNDDKALERISYYSFEIELIDDDDDNNYKIIIIISSIAVVVIFIIIFIIIKYRKMIKKNKDLERKVSEVSFSDGNDEDENKVTFV